MGEAVTFGQEQFMEEDLTSSSQQATFPAVGGIRARVLNLGPGWYIFVYLYVNIYIYVYMCTYSYTHMNIQTYTYIMHVFVFINI